MDTLEIYLTRMTTVRDGIKFLIGTEPLPTKLSEHLYSSLIQLGREVDRVQRLIKANAKAAEAAKAAAGNSGGSDFTESSITTDELPPVDKAIQKKAAKS